MGAYNSPMGCWATRLWQGALPAITGFVFYLGLASGQIPGIANVRSAGTPSPHNATKTIQDGFVGSRSCVPCHQNIYDKFPSRPVNRKGWESSADLLPKAVRKAASEVG
ncbi:MAG: hypothetical protein DMG53_01440 [Acidobacteria bacterium]|nr:MAG: hypothetical protein DMG53_01440 [Acidobacteriota bacterium]